MIDYGMMECKYIDIIVYSLGQYAEMENRLKYAINLYQT